MITDIKLDQLEKKRQADSDWILNRIELIPKLQKYGEVKIAGAKALGLMYAKDIDISVVVNEVKTADWQKLVCELITTPHVRNISAIDYYNYDDQNRYNPVTGQKYSLYISINNMLGPEDDKLDTWECQIHMIEPKMFDESKVSGVINKLNPEKRLVILRIKYWADEINRKLKAITNGNYKIYSPAIYEAVLDKNIDTVEAFLDLFSPSVPDNFQKSFDAAVSQVLEAEG